MNKFPIYYCNPDKNKKCSKTHCFYKNSKNNCCFATPNPECALAKNGKARIYCDSSTIDKGYEYYNKRDARIINVLSRHKV